MAAAVRCACWRSFRPDNHDFPRPAAANPDCPRPVAAVSSRREPPECRRGSGSPWMPSLPGRPHAKTGLISPASVAHDVPLAVTGACRAVVKNERGKRAMSNKETDRFGGEDPLADTSQLLSQEVPAGVDRRAFLIRSAVGGAAAVMVGRPVSAEERTAMAVATLPPQASAAPPLAADLNVVKKSKGPVLTTVDEFYKVGPGPSSSHTIGPMRITYDFYQRAAKLPADKLAQATALRVNLFGSLSATGKGHGTERAALAGLAGYEPATIDPAILDELAANPSKTFPVKLGSKTLTVGLKDVVYDAPKGEFHHPNTMKVALLAGDKPLLEDEYYSVGG